MHGPAGALPNADPMIWCLRDAPRVIVGVTVQLSADAHKQIAQLVGTLRPYVAVFFAYCYSIRYSLFDFDKTVKRI